MPTAVLHDLSPITEADLPDIARIHLAAFPDSALTQVGREAVRRYYHWLITGPHDAVAVAARHDGAVLGFAFGGVFSGAVSGFVRANRLYLASRVALNPRLLAGELFRSRVRIGLRGLRRGPPPRAAVDQGAAGSTRRSFGVLAIAVDPGGARSGVGTALMTHLEAAARDRGFAGMHLTVSPENGGAVRFYERLGWARVAAADGWHGAMRKATAGR